MAKLDVPVDDSPRNPPRLARGTERQMLLDKHELEPALCAEDVMQIVRSLEEPLAHLLLETSLLEAYDSAEARAARRIAGSVATLARIASDLADVAAIQQDRLILRRRPHELRALICETIERSISPRKRARVYIDAPSACLAFVDARRIERAITTLVESALQASPPGSDVIVRLEETGGAALLSIIDARCDRSEPDAFESPARGFALYACRRIVESHGGRIALDTCGGTGARVHVELPVHEVEQVSIVGLRILLVDDDARQLDALATLLRRQGLVVHCAENGSAAVVALRTHPIDLAIVDAMLPDVGGTDLVCQLQAEHVGLPLIVVSGHPPDSGPVAAMLDASGGRYFGKPIDVDELLAEIARCVDPASE